MIGKGGLADLTPPDLVAMAWYELNDLGNARRLADLAAGGLLWVEDHWRAFDGRRWSPADGERLAQCLAHDVTRHIAVEAESLLEQLAAMDPIRKANSEKRLTERAANLFRHATFTGNTAKISGMLAQARSTLWARRTDFDRDPLAINVRNGTLRFTLGREGWHAGLCPHDPADLISRLAAVDYDPAAAHMSWHQHLATVLPSEPVREFFQRAAGYGALGEISEQVIFLLHGKGGDGKSTTMNAIREVLGDYGSNADVQTFMVGAQRSGGEASPDLARLAGDVRIVSTGEPRPGGMLDEGRIKALTGGSAITARELHKPPFEYVPHFKVFFECNRKPRISGDDDGIWRRVLVIWFPHQLKGAEIDKHAQRRLLEEGPGILNWLIEGAMVWLQTGSLAPPVEVCEAIEDYRRAANPFGEWFDDCVSIDDPAARTLSKVLYDDYKTWCDANDIGEREIMSMTAFGRALSDKQLAKMKDSAGRSVRRGVHLKTRVGIDRRTANASLDRAASF